MTSSRKNNEVTEGANKAADGLESLSGVMLDPPEPPTAENIYTRIADDLVRVNDMLNKAKEYGNPRTMFKNISMVRP